VRGKDGSRVLVNGGWQTTYPAVEVFEVAGDHSFATAQDDPPVVVGGPEDLLSLADLGVLGGEPTVLAADLTGAPGSARRLVLTDGLRATERSFGRVHDGASATRVPGEPRRLPGASRDYLTRGAARWSTTARIEGAREIEASSSMSDASAVGTVQGGELPFAAVDGDPVTAWTASYDTRQPAWWQVLLPAARRVDRVRVTAGPDSDEVVRVRTRHRVSAPVSLGAGVSRTFEVDDPATDRVRVSDASGRVGHRLALAEVAVPGLRVHRSLVLPALPSGWRGPDDIVLRAVADRRTGCARVEGSVRCVRGRQVAAEEPSGFARELTLPERAVFRPSVTVRGRPGEALDRLLLRDQPVGIAGSSTGVPDPRASAVAAIDGDPGTTWTASESDLGPTLRLSWLGVRRVRGLDLTLAADAPARLPHLLTLTWPGGRRQVEVTDGRVRFPAIRTDQLALRVDEADPAVSLDFRSVGSPLPVGIGELRLTGVPLVPVRLPDRPVRHPCGTGPTVVVNGRALPTSVPARPAGGSGGSADTATVCGATSVALDGGSNRVEIRASGAFVPVSLVLSDRQVPSSSPRPVSSTADGPVRRTLAPDRRPGLVTTRQNTNPGWRATQGGRDVRAVVVDGWQQGWQPTGSGPVRTTFGPDRPYRWGLLAGLLAFLALLVAACVPRVLGSAEERDAPPVTVRTAGGALLGSLVVLTGGLLAGWAGVVLATGAFLVASVLNRRAAESAPWLLAAVVLPAAGAYALRPWGGSEGWAGDLSWPAYLVLVGCAALFGLPADRLLRRPRAARRIPGLSTRR
jgi:arabinofuranan 3-O-arabinosyltransferase